MGARKIILKQGRSYAASAGLPNFVRKILHRVNFPFFRIVLSSLSGEPLNFQSKRGLTCVEAGLIQFMEAD
jgi:hypothetical protein